MKITRPVLAIVLSGLMAAFAPGLGPYGAAAQVVGGATAGTLGSIPIAPFVPSLGAASGVVLAPLLPAAGLTTAGLAPNPISASPVGVSAPALTDGFSPSAASEGATKAEALEALFTGARSRDFLEWEMVNDHFNSPKVESTVAEAYRPKPGREFDINYLEVPVEDIHVLDSGLGGPSREHIYTERDGRRFVRFFIHPESEALYSGLIARYGVRGSYRAAPTASTRSLLAWDPKAPERGPVFLKLSLDRKQFGLGRAVSDWEVRRSVLVSKLAARIPEEESRRYGVSVISEFAGAYIGKEWAAGSYIDKKQHTSFEHGMLFRDVGFLDRFPGLELFPLFSLFSMRGKREPLIIEWWKDQARGRKLSFEDFIDEALIAPVVRATAYLNFEQGIIPDAHGQNLVVAVDPKTRRVVHVLHRDTGSMKIDMRLRLAKQHSVADLRTSNAAYDFKAPWASAIAGTSLLHWFYDYLFTNWRGQDKSLRPYIPGYDPEKINRLIQKHLARSLEEHLPVSGISLSGPITIETVEKRINDYVRAQRPRLAVDPALALSASPAWRLIRRQQRLGQILELPREWFSEAELSAPLYCEAGVVYRKRDGRVFLVFLPPAGAAEAAAPAHYEINLPFSRIDGSAELFHGLASALGDVSAHAPPAPKTFEERVRVVKWGPSSRPRYRLVGAKDDARSQFEEGRSKLEAVVVLDITDLAAPAQERILAQFDPH